MSTSFKAPPFAAFQSWATANRHLAQAVRDAQRFADTERRRVTEYADPLFQRYGFKDRDGKLISDRSRLYTSCAADEARWPAYFSELDAANRAHGFTGPKDHCPALIAETRQHEAERALMQAAATLFNIPDVPLYGDVRARFLALLLRACLNDDIRG